MSKYFTPSLLISLFFAGCVFGKAHKSNFSFPARQATVNQDSLDSRLNSLVRQISEGLTENQKQRIAVVEFVDLNGNVSDFGRYLAEELITRLYQTKKIKVIERQLLNKIIAEQKLSLTGIIEVESAQKLGKLLGVDAICSGSISDLGKSLKLNARLINTETGEVFSVAAIEILKDESVCALGGCTSANNSQTNSESANENTQQSFNKPMKVIAGAFTFELKNCLRRGALVVCEFTVTNSDIDQKLTLGASSIRVFDDSNNEHRATGIQMTNRGKRDWDSLSMATDIPVKVLIYFDGIDENAKKLTLLQISFSGQRLGSKRLEAKFQDIPLINKQ